jgi:hypothetical protein
VSIRGAAGGERRGEAERRARGALTPKQLGADREGYLPVLVLFPSEIVFHWPSGPRVSHLKL